MMLITLGPEGHLTIPDEVLRAAHLREGDVVEVEISERGLLLRPRRIAEETQAWFWDATWQAGELEADEDLRAGRTSQFLTGEEMIARLTALTEL
jgi:antitoxin PrlF